MAATGSHPFYQDLFLRAVSNGRWAGLGGQQFPHHSRLLLLPPSPLYGPAMGTGQCAGSLLIADLVLHCFLG